MTESDSIAGTTDTNTASDDAASDLTTMSSGGQTAVKKTAAKEAAVKETRAETTAVEDTTSKETSAKMESANLGEVEDAVLREPKASAIKAAGEDMMSSDSASEGESDEAAKAEDKQEKPKPVPAEPPPRAESSFGKSGQEVKIQHFDTEESRAACSALFDNNPYAWPEGVKNPEVIMDIGAYVGASSILFARQFPSATVHAYEPCTASRTLLSENVAAYPNVKVREEALWDRDEDRKLFDGKKDPLTASLVPSTANVASGEEVKARHADEALDDLNLARSDAVKINTGGSEVAILQAMIRHMEATPVVFINYRSETDRRRIDLILCATHMLVAGTIEGPHRGQLVYGLRRVMDANAVGEKDAVRLHRTPFK